MEFFQLCWLTLKAENPRLRKRMAEMEIRILGLQTEQSFVEISPTNYPAPTEHYNAQWKKNRKAILERDDFACVDCGSQNNLLIHHKKPMRQMIVEAISSAHQLGNLETLCRDCHKQQHNKKPKNQ